jgi:hypothetical protein
VTWGEVALTVVGQNDLPVGLYGHVSVDALDGDGSEATCPELVDEIASRGADRRGNTERGGQRPG